MTIEDKPIFLAFCQIPRFGLSAAQVADIEKIVDGRSLGVGRMAVTYAEAAAALGFTSANSAKTIEKYVREGKLERAAPGRVTVASMRNLMERPEGRRSDMGVGANREGRRSDRRVA